MVNATHAEKKIILWWRHKIIEKGKLGDVTSLFSYNVLVALPKWVYESFHSKVYNCSELYMR